MALQYRSVSCYWAARFQSFPLRQIHIFVPSVTLAFHKHYPGVIWLFVLLPCITGTSTEGLGGKHTNGHHPRLIPHLHPAPIFGQNWTVTITNRKPKLINRESNPPTVLVIIGCTSLKPPSKARVRYSATKTRERANPGQGACTSQNQRKYCGRKFPSYHLRQGCAQVRPYNFHGDSSVVHTHLHSST